jgi:hypothetical protein
MNDLQLPSCNFLNFIRQARQIQNNLVELIKYFEKFKVEYLIHLMTQLRYRHYGQSLVLTIQHHHLGNAVQTIQ